jgi:xylulokinase
LPIGCEGLMASGMLGGCAMPLVPAMRGQWSGFSWNHKREHFFRALLESYSYEFAMTTDVVDAVYPEYANAPVRVIGGGSKSALWNQMHADVSGRTYSTIDRDDVALWGACIMAGKAVGIFDDMKKVSRAHVRQLRSYEPDGMRNKQYRELMDVYKKYVGNSQDGFETLTAIR